MKKTRFKTKLNRKQKRNNILVFILVAILSYAFVLLFSYGIGLFDGWPTAETWLLALALSFFILSMTLMPVMLAAIALGCQKGKAKRIRDDSSFIPVKNIVYYRDNIKEINPSLASLLIDLDIYGKKDIAATLLRMQNKKIIDIQKNGSIVILSENRRNLDNNERQLLYIVKNGLLKNRKSLSGWKQSQFIEAERLGYIKKTKVDKNKSVYLYLSISLLSIFTAVCLWSVFLHLDLYKINSVPTAVLSFSFLLLTDVILFVPLYFAIQRAVYYKRGDVLWERTPLGNEMAEKIAGLGRFIHEFSRLSEAKKEEVVLWGDYLVYAIVLEENEKVVNEISGLCNFNLRSFDRMHLFQ